MSIALRYSGLSPPDIPVYRPTIYRPGRACSRVRSTTSPPGRERESPYRNEPGRGFRPNGLGGVLDALPERPATATASDRSGVRRVGSGNDRTRAGLGALPLFLREFGREFPTRLDNVLGGTVPERVIGRRALDALPRGESSRRDSRSRSPPRSPPRRPRGRERRREP